MAEGVWHEGACCLSCRIVKSGSDLLDEFLLTLHLAMMLRSLESPQREVVGAVTGVQVRADADRAKESI